MVRTRYKPTLLYKTLSILLCSAMLLNSIALPPVLYAQSTENGQDGKPAVYLPLIQSMPLTSTPLPSDNSAEIAMVSAATQGLPTPSGALPPYPVNHTLDGVQVDTGSLLPNPDFATSGYAIGTPPSNYDFSTVPYTVGTPPTNHDFEAGTLTGWTVTGSVTLQNDSTHGYWARLQSSGILVSEPITVAATAQQLILDLGYLTTNNYSWAEIYVLSGAGYSTETKIGNPQCYKCGNWVSYTADLSSYQGQSIKLKFKQRGGTVGIDLVRQQASLPGYTAVGEFTRVTDMNGDAYVELRGGSSIISPPFVIENLAQFATVRLRGLTDLTDQFWLYVLSGTNFATATRMSEFQADDTGTLVNINLYAWRNQTIKLKVVHQYGAVAVDNIGLQKVNVPGWQVPSGYAEIITDTNGQRSLRVKGKVTSDPFSVSAVTQQMKMGYRLDHPWCITWPELAETLFGSFALYAVDGSSRNPMHPLSAHCAGEETIMGLANYGERLISVELVTSSTYPVVVHFGRGEHVLPGWMPDTLDDAISTGTDQHGSYVTPANDEWHSLWVRSQPISTGIIDRPNHTDMKFYSVSYDFGYTPSAIFQVYWINEAGSVYTVLQEGADVPTGYRTRYFWLADFLGQRGRFVVRIGGRGKLYSIADNIARQQLNEPFAYKVGSQIDSATGAFGYQAQDLVVGGAMPLIFTRYYNGHSDQTGIMGHGWSHSYATRVVRTEDNDALVILGSGRELYFDGKGTPLVFTPADARIHDTLVKNADNSYTFTTKDKMAYWFDANGVLQSVRDANNNTVTLGYTAGQLTTVSGPGGAALTLAYTNGLLQSVTDPVGGNVTFGYDGNGDLVTAARADRGTESYQYDRHHLSKVIDANQNTLFENHFDTLNRVIQQTDAQQQTITVNYDTPSTGVTQVVDPNGNAAYYYFDQAQRTTARVDPTGNVVSYLYDGVGNLQKVVDAAFGEWDFAYDGNGNLLNTQDPVGNPTQIAYNPQNLPTTVVDGNGNVTWMSYDGAGNLVQMVDPLSYTTTFTYNGSGQMLSMTNPLGHTEHYTYDGSGNRLSRTDALGHTWQWSYNAANRVTSETDPNGHTTNYFYDLAGRIIAIRNHLSKQKTFLYDDVGHLIMSEDELGRRTVWDYDERGLVEAKIDPNLKVTTYTYDDNRNMISMTDPVGLTTQYEYDANNRLTKTIGAGGAATQYSYDVNGRLSTETDALGRVTQYQYDAAGQLVMVQYANGSSYHYQYDANGNQTHITDPLNRTTLNGYDALNRLKTVTDPLGNVTTQVYDAAGRLVARKDATNHSVTYSYDAADRMVATTDALGRLTQYGYDAAGNPITTTSPLNQLETTVYDAVNRPVQLIDALGQVTQMVYDAAGQQTQVIQPTGATTTYVYDVRGLLAQVTNPLQQVTTYTYDDGGRLSQMTDVANQTTTYTYNNTGRLAAVTNALGKSTSYGYDLVGNRTTVTDPLGRVTTTAYDTLNRVSAVTDAGNRTRHYTYDNAGQLLQDLSPAGRATTYQYDARGLVTSISNALGYSESYEYNALGQRTRVIDPRGNSTYFGYDFAGQLTTITDTLSSVVRFAYDAGGRLTSLTNPNGKSSTFTYDPLNHLLTSTDPLNRTHSNSYDQYGRLATRTDARGIAISYTYDALDRVTALTHPAGVNNYTYTAGGQVATVTDPTGTTTYTYDTLARVTAIASPQGTVSYGYNDADQRSSMTLPGGKTISYNYDASGRLASLTDWVSGSLNYSYDDDGNLTGLNRSNGVNSVYGYDAAGRLTNLSHAGPNGALLFTNYTLDNSGNRIAMTSAAGTESYTLDALNRLTNVAYPNGDSAAYTYDANGNRLTESFNGALTTYSYDDAGQLLASGVMTYTYDANGNLTSAGTDNYTWDWANRLINATVGSNNAVYQYDAFDIRVNGAVNGVTTSYLWDRLAPYPTVVDDGAYSYIHSVGPQAQIDSSGNRYDLLGDALGSIRGITDNSGALVGQATYDAFGAIRSQSGVASAFGYTGELYTAATGLLHLRARDLTPGLGRFLSADTVQPNAPGSQGYNLYAYVANNPTSWVDPSGHDAQANILSTIQMLPPLSANAALLGVALGSLIKTTLIIGRSAASWTLSRQHITEKLVLGVFGLVLACGRIERCMNGMRYYSNLAAQAGSDALAGVTVWTASQLQEVAGLWPYPPTVARPQNSPNNLGGLNNPLGPWLQACMLGGVLSGVANLTADAYGYQGTPTQNATIAANVMYNVVTCGAAGGGSSGGSGGGGGSSSNKSVDDTIKSVSSRLPQRPGGKGPTAGFLIDSDGNVIGDMIVSGSKRSLPPAEFNMIRDPEGLLPPPTQGRLSILSDVELKVARYMREHNLTDATLVLNNHPCSGRYSCSEWLDRTMPVGSNLRVVVPEGFDARGSFDHPFTGK